VEWYAAFFAELDYAIDGIRHHLSTQIRVAGPKGDEKAAGERETSVP
jgi:hypothetical protein